MGTGVQAEETRGRVFFFCLDCHTFKAFTINIYPSEGTELLFLQHMILYHVSFLDIILIIVIIVCERESHAV